MGTKGVVSVDSGTGIDVKTFLDAALDHQQYVREIRADAESDNSWTVSTTASTSQIAADINRVGMLMVSAANGRVYLRFDATAPTATAYHWYLEPGDRWEVPSHLVELAVSMLGASAGGTILTHLGTAA
jgi:hypothetical protein